MLTVLNRWARLVQNFMKHFNKNIEERQRRLLIFNLLLHIKYKI
jgi:hypothetical protein